MLKYKEKIILKHLLIKHYLSAHCECLECIYLKSSMAIIVSCNPASAVYRIVLHTPSYSITLSSLVLQLHFWYYTIKAGYLRYLCSTISYFNKCKAVVSTDELFTTGYSVNFSILEGWVHNTMIRVGWCKAKEVSLYLLWHSLWLSALLSDCWYCCRMYV